MWDKLRSVIVVSLLVFAAFVTILNFGINDTTVEGATLYVGPTSTYKRIQDAVDNASFGDTIYVDNGTYYESVTIKTPGISLIGNSTTDCKIIHHYDGSGFTDWAAGFNVSANYVNITGFNINVSGAYTFGIYLLSNSDNSKMINNNITTTGSYGFGMYIEFSDNNSLINNIIRTTNSSAYGIINYYSSNNNITSNTINTSGSGSGIYVQGDSFYNNITNNIINSTELGGGGIVLDLCVGNNITGNVINTNRDKSVGITFIGATNNNVTNNTIKTVSTCINLGAKSINNNLIGNKLNTTEDLTAGIRAGQNLEKNNITNNFIETAGDRSPGIELGNNNQNYNVVNNTINTTGLDSYGIYLRTSTNNNNIIGNTINTSGQDAYGIYLFQNSYDNNLTENTINTSGLDAYGIYLEQASDNKNVNDNIINTFGSGGYGIYLDRSSNTKNIDGNTINTFGINGNGIFLEQTSNININGNIIKTFDQGGAGIYCWASSNNNNITGNIINATEFNGYGICLHNSCNNYNITGNAINTSGANGRAVYLRSSANYNNISGNSVYTHGTSGWGIFIWQNSEHNNCSDNEINTYGSNGHGIFLAGSNWNNITNHTIVTAQSNAYGIYMESSNNTYISTCDITSGSDGIRIWEFLATVEDSIISSSNGFDINLQNDANITAINCSFSTVEAIKGTLLVWNYLTVQAYYNDTFTPISGADVMVEDNSFVVYQSPGYGGADPQTNSNGQIDEMLIFDRWYKYSNTAFENITSVRVKKTVDLSWEEVRSDVNMNSSHTEVFVSDNIIAPTTPTGLMVSRVPMTNNLTISWNQNPEVDIVNYTVYTNKTGTWNVLANITYPQNSTLDTDLPDETWYYYQIQAWDVVGLSSGISSPVSYFLADIIPPAVPKGFTAGPVPGGDAINVSWNLNTDDTVKYELWWRDSPDGSWVHLGNFSSTTSWFILEHESLINSSTHYFRLRAWDELDNPSDFTPDIEVTHRDYEQPESPTNFMAEAVSETEINLNWSASITADVLNYWVYKNTSGSGSGGPYQFIVELNAQTLEYQTTGLLENVTYYFVVQAFDEAGNPSVISNEAVDTTFAVPPNAPILDTLPTITNTQTLNVTGTAEVNARILIYSNNNELGNGTTNSSGGFGIEITLLEGDNVIKAMAIDRADLTSPHSSIQTVRLDITDPVANAGDDLNITQGAKITFNGTGSTDNYEIVNYTWSFLYDGSTKELFGPTPSFTFDQAGDYEVTLTITDGAGNIGKDSLMVLVKEKIVPDTIPPIANAGSDKAIKIGQSVTFDGSASTDNIGISNYTWTFTYNGNELTLYGESPVYTFSAVGNYEVTLTVIDLALPPNRDTDTMWVNVTQDEIDTDEDGLPDAWEDEHGLDKNDPTDAANDTDSDELNNLDEYEKGTDPRDSDSDNDGLPDGWEVLHSLNPLIGTGDDGADGDPDGDTYTNLEEYNAKTNPQDPEEKPVDKKDDDDDDSEEADDNIMMFLALIILVIIIIAILAFALTRGKKAAGAPEETLAEEEAEEPIDEDEDLEDENIDMEDVEEPEMEMAEELGDEEEMELEELEELDDDEPVVEEEGGKGDNEEEEDSEDEFECPNCGAALGADDDKCKECGAEFE